MVLNVLCYLAILERMVIDVQNDEVSSVLNVEKIVLNVQNDAVEKIVLSVQNDAVERIVLSDQNDAYSFLSSVGSL